jgi:hypothetical protein
MSEDNNTLYEFVPSLNALYDGNEIRLTSRIDRAARMMKHDVKSKQTQQSLTRTSEKSAVRKEVEAFGGRKKKFSFSTRF